MHTARYEYFDLMEFVLPTEFGDARIVINGEDGCFVSTDVIGKASGSTPVMVNKRPVTFSLHMERDPATSTWGPWRNSNGHPTTINANTTPSATRKLQEGVVHAVNVWFEEHPSEYDAGVDVAINNEVWRAEAEFVKAEAAMAAARDKFFALQSRLTDWRK